MDIVIELENDYETNRILDEIKQTYIKVLDKAKDIVGYDEYIDYELLKNIDILFDNNPKYFGKIIINQYKDKSFNIQSLTINYDAYTFSELTKNEIINETIPHEVAHILAYILYGEIDHSENWKNICIALGGSGNEYTNINYIKPKRNLKLYKCFINDSDYVIITSIRYNKIMKGQTYIFNKIEVNKQLKFEEYIE